MVLIIPTNGYKGLALLPIQTENITFIIKEIIPGAILRLEELVRAAVVQAAAVQAAAVQAAVAQAAAVQAVVVRAVVVQAVPVVVLEELLIAQVIRYGIPRWFTILPVNW